MRLLHAIFVSGKWRLMTAVHDRGDVRRGAKGSNQGQIVRLGVADSPEVSVWLERRRIGRSDIEDEQRWEGSQIALNRPIAHGD